MGIRLLACVTGLAAVLAASTAFAQELPPEPAPACSAPAHAGHPMLQRLERIAEYEKLGDQCLKQLMIECNSAASRALLDPGAAIACSIGYEALLKRSFGGDFQAMLAWWRTRSGPPAYH